MKLTALIICAATIWPIPAHSAETIHVEVEVSAFDNVVANCAQGEQDSDDCKRAKKELAEAGGIYLTDKEMESGQ